VSVNGTVPDVDPRPADASAIHEAAIGRKSRLGGAWLTAAEIAATFRVDRSTVYKWASAGVVPSTKIGGTRRFDAAAIEALKGVQ